MLIFYLIACYLLGYFLPSRSLCDPVKFRAWLIIAPVTVPVAMLVIAYRSTIDLLDSIPKKGG